MDTPTYADRALQAQLEEKWDLAVLLWQKAMDSEENPTRRSVIYHALGRAQERATSMPNSAPALLSDQTPVDADDDGVAWVPPESRRPGCTCCGNGLCATCRAEMPTATPQEMAEHRAEIAEEEADRLKEKNAELRRQMKHDEGMAEERDAALAALALVEAAPADAAPLITPRAFLKGWRAFLLDASLGIKAGFGGAR